MATILIGRADRPRVSKGLPGCNLLNTGTSSKPAVVNAAIGHGDIAAAFRDRRYQHQPVS